jgi:hypothetical protein
MKYILFFLTFVFIIFPSCSQSTSNDDNPTWVKAIIEKYENNSNGNRPSIWRYEYKGITVYFVIAPCCDQANILYDVNGNEICSPSGGYFGNGDGRCPDFVQERKNEKLIWPVSGK